MLNLPCARRVRSLLSKTFLAGLFATCVPLVCFGADEPQATADSVNLAPVQPASDSESAAAPPDSPIVPAVETPAASVVVEETPEKLEPKPVAAAAAEELQVPVTSLITSAKYAVRINQDVAHIDVELAIRVLGKPWVELPISFAQAPIIEMTASDHGVLLRGTGDGAYSLLFPTAGEHVIGLKLMTRVRKSTDDAGVEFRIPASALAVCDVLVPIANQALELSSHGVVVSSVTNAEHTRLTANLGATEMVSLRWRPLVRTVPPPAGVTSTGMAPASATDATAVAASAAEASRETVPAATAEPVAAAPVQNASTDNDEPSITQALIEAVVSTDKTVTYRSRYRIDGAAASSLLLALPQQSEVVEARIDGRKVAIQKSSAPPSNGRETFTMDLARLPHSEQPAVLAIVFKAPFKMSLLRGRGGNLSLPMPRVLLATAEGSTPVAMPNLRTAVWVPRGWSLVGTPANFTNEQEASIDLLRGTIDYVDDTREMEEWFGDTNAALPPLARNGKAYIYEASNDADVLDVSYWQIDWLTWFMSGALLLAGVVLARTSWENRLTLLLAAGFIGAMFAVRDADLALNIFAAARWGLLSMAAYWMIRAVTHWRPEHSRHVPMQGDIHTRPATSLRAAS